MKSKVISNSIVLAKTFIFIKPKIQKEKMTNVLRRIMFKSQDILNIYNTFSMKIILITLLLITLITSQGQSSSFTLSFQYAARANVPLESSQIQVFWNDNIISSIIPANYNLNTVTLNVVANRGQNLLSFAGAGTPDSLGVGLGNVKLVRGGTTNNIVVNGNFATPNLRGGWSIFNGISGWTGNDIQVGQGTIYNGGWAGQGQIVELDGNRNALISQAFNFDLDYNLVSNTPTSSGTDTTTTPYTLEFDWAPRTNGISNLASSQGNVFFNGGIVTSLVSTPANSGVNHFKGTVQVNGYFNKLQFDGTGISDGYGITISNVQLYSGSDSTNVLVNGDFSQPALPVGTWKYINGGIPGWTASPAEVGTRTIYNSAWSAGQAIELDTTGNTRYTQTFTVEQVKSSNVVLSFTYAARANVPFGSNIIEVLWNNNIVSTVVPTDYKIRTVFLPLTLNVGANVLAFAGAGKSDGYGSDISSVALVQQGSTTNLLVNGDFSQPPQNGGWSISKNIPGWTGAEIQVGQGTIYNSVWSGKGQLVELDGKQNSLIKQTITFSPKFNQIPNVQPATPANTATQQYNLQFDWAPRTNGISNLDSSQANVFFNDILVASLVSTATNSGVNHFSGSVAFGAGPNVLAFDGTGASDSYGVTISNVQLFAPSSTTNLIVNGDFSSPALGGSWRSISGGITGWTAAVAQVGSRKIYNSAWSDGQAIELDSNTNTRYFQIINGPSASHKAVRKHLLLAHPSI